LPELFGRTAGPRLLARAKLDDPSQRGVEAADEAGERVETYLALADVLALQMDPDGTSILRVLPPDIEISLTLLRS
jgi:hypothetical protein